MKRNLTTSHHRNKIACLEKQSILDLPEEVIEEIMSFLSFSDLFNLIKVEKRLENCAKRVMKKKPLKIAIITSNTGMHGQYQGCKNLYNVEVISIHKDSISHINSSLPSLPKAFHELRGTQSPNRALVICGGFTVSGDYSHLYLRYNEGSNQWTKVGAMKKARNWHSSVWIDGRLLTTGGRDASCKTTSHHEEFSFDGGVKERKEMPIALLGHTATTFDQNKVMICGGINEKWSPSQRSFIYDITKNSWTEGPSLLIPKCHHSSCAIPADDGSTQSIIIIGGVSHPRTHRVSKTTEILDMKNLKWMQGPELPIGIKRASCVGFPPASNFACVLVGGETEGKNPASYRFSSNVYGLDRSLNEWTLLGKIRTGSRGVIALPLS